MNRILHFLLVRMRRSSLFFGIAIFSFILLFSVTSKAAVWLYDPTITLKQEYDDNYRLSTNSSNEDEVWTTTLTGELALRGKSDRSDIAALIRLDAINYSGDDDDLRDKNNQLFGLSGRHSVSDRNAFRLNARYRRDTILRNSQIDVDPGDTGAFIDEDGVLIDDTTDLDVDLVRENIRRERFLITPGWNYLFDERTEISLDYTYRDLSFDNEESTSLVESEAHRFRGNISRRLSEKNTLVFEASAGYFEPDNNNDVDNYEATIELLRKFSKTFAMDFKLGGRYSEFDRGNKSDDTGFVANVGATKRTERTRYRLFYRRDVAPSGSGNAVEVNEIGARAQHALTEKLDLNLKASWFDTDTLDSGIDSSSDREVIRLEPGLKWRFLENWVAGASYRYRERDLDNDGSGDSNGAFISISYSPPRQF